MKINLNDPKIQKQAEDAAKGFAAILPEGKHYMRCTDVVYKTVNDKPAWELHLVVMPGEPEEQSTCRDTLFWTEKALGRLLLCLSAFGLKDRELDAVDPEDQKCQNLLRGRTAIVEIQHSKPDKNNKVWANPTYAGYSAAHKGAVDEMRRERDAAPAVPAAGPASGAAQPAEKEAFDDRVPF